MQFYSKTKLIISIVIGISLSVTMAFVVYHIQMESVNTKKEIEQVKTQVQDLIDKLYKEGNVSYMESSKIGYDEGMRYSYLSSHNLLIAIAKFNVKTKAYHDDPETIRNSKKAYRTKSRVTTTAVLLGLLSPIITIPSILLVVFILTITWYFILNRIDELSKAIQGKR